MIIDKNSMIKKKTNPFFGEIVKHCAKEGVFVGVADKYGSSYNIHFYGCEHSQLVPAGQITFTGKSDQAYQNACLDKNTVHGVGGLMTGPRVKVRSSPETTLKKQDRDLKTKTSGLKDKPESEGELQSVKVEV